MEGEDFDETQLFATFDATDGNLSKNISGKSSKKKMVSESELEMLRNENDLLKKVIRRIVSSCEEAPLASVVFFDSEQSGNAANIEEILKQFFARRRRGSHNDNDQTKLSVNGDNESMHAKHSSFCDGFKLALGRCAANSEQGDNLTNEEVKLTENLVGLPCGSVQYFSSFCLDHFGSDVVDPVSVERCNYEQVYFNVLPITNDKNPGKKMRAKQMCFNCDGSHKLQECTKPRNLVRISAKRREFMENFSSPFAQEARYHADKAKQEKFQHLVPGQWSPELREALGLAERDLPPFIYRMRMLGYPPGWLPSNHDSGIVIHGAEGVTNSTNGEENAEIDHTKLVQYPGFNVPMPRGVKDISTEVRLPVMNPHVQLRLPIASDDTPKRKHRDSSYDEDNSGERSKRRRRMSSDMDIDSNDTDDVNGDMTSRPDAPYTPTIDTRNSRYSPTTPNSTYTPASAADLEDGEIPDSPGDNNSRADNNRKVSEIKPRWWLEEPLMPCGVKVPCEDSTSLEPPPFPLRPLPLHKISQILPGEMNHISFEDRDLWLDPIFGNLQIRTGRYDRLKTILATREKKKQDSPSL